MKKIVFLLMFISLIAAFAFAENFTVQSLTGRVERESGKQRIALKVGDTLDGETRIFTSIGASVVLKDSAEKIVTVPAARNGKVADLAKAATGVRISGNVTRIDTSSTGRTTAQIGTASARASEAAGDLDMAAE